MPGLYNTMHIAKRAISAQQLGLNVSGHNIANVNNPHYSRQRLPLEASEPARYYGQIVGTGVDVDKINQVVNSYMESRLTSNKSTFSSLEAQQNYMSVLDSLLNENNDSSISKLISNFYGSWQNLSNNPGGVAERVSVFKSGNTLATQLTTLDDGLAGVQFDLSREIDAGVSKINSITSEIAKVNQTILSQEVGNQKANDLRDKRRGLIQELGEYIDVKTFEQPSGSLIVTTMSGHTLVYDDDTYKLNTKDNSIFWEGSYGNERDITSSIKTGKLGGWLEMRDATIPKFRSDLESMTKEIIWQTNYAHSQGAGTNYYDTALEGTYKTEDNRWLSTLDFGSRIDYTKDFKMWVKDDRENPPTYNDYGFDMGMSTARVSNYSGDVDVAAGAPPYKYKFTVVKSGNVDGKDSPEDPVILWEKYSNEGLRLKSGYSEIEKEGSVTIDKTSTSSGISFDIDSGKLVAGNTFNINTNDKGYVDPPEISVSGIGKRAQETYQFKVIKSGDPTKGEVSGEVGIDPITISWSSGTDSGEITLTPKDPYKVPLEAEIDGIKFAFAGGTMLNGDMFVVNTDPAGNPSIETESDFKWTLDSFRDEFNKNVKGVSANISAENKLSFAPETDGFEITNQSRTGAINMPETRLKILNTSALTTDQKDIKVTRDSNGNWTLTGFAGGKYPNASIVPKPIKVIQAGGTAATPDSIYNFEVTKGGKIGTDEVVINWTNNTSGAAGTITLTPPLPTPSVSGVDGMDFNFEDGSRLYQGDSFTMNADSAGNTTLDKTPSDKGFGIDLTGNGIADLDMDFVKPVEGAGTYKFDIEADKGDYSYSFSDNQSEDSGILAAMGVNTFFTGNDLATMKVNTSLQDNNFIAAGKIKAAERPPVKSDNALEVPVFIKPGVNDTIQFTEGNSEVLTAKIIPSFSSGGYTNEDEMEILASDIEKSLEDASEFGINYKVEYNRDTKIFEISQDKGGVEKDITIHWNSSSAGQTLGFDADDDTLTPPSDKIKEGDLVSDDSSNALALAKIQDLKVTISRWSYSRTGEPISEPSVSTIEGFYHGMVNDLGVTAAGIKRGYEFQDTLVQRLSQDRDAVSGVSLDEEMVDLMKFQHAYTVASKLLTVADEMLQTLVNIK